LSYSWNEVMWKKNGVQGCLCTRTSALLVKLQRGTALRHLARSGADGTTCLESLLKEISVIVSMGLASHDFAPEPASRTRPREIFGAVIAGSLEHSGRNAASDCGGLGWSRLPRSAQTLFNARTTFPRAEGNQDKTRGATGYM
jgi:hypothetical protein